MAPSVLQNGGFILGLIGAAALIAATAMNNWSVKDRQTEVVTSVYTYKGLWQDCETTSAGLTECRPLYGLLGYSGFFQAVRALMIVGVVLSVLGAGISIFSLSCLTMNKMQDTAKAKMSLTAGIMFIIAGVCGIAGASMYANQIVASFKMSTYSNYGGGMMAGGMGMGMGGGMGEGMPTYDIILLVCNCMYHSTVGPTTGLVCLLPLMDYHSEGGKKNQNYV
uniref:Claudin n=1 Tax=Amphilophus citrinellus TaxID=61819 RepID=A0A3Q0T201_AMPCI